MNADAPAGVNAIHRSDATQCNAVEYKCSLVVVLLPLAAERVSIDDGDEEGAGTEGAERQDATMMI